MTYRLAIYHGTKATIRKADDGITDIEWEHGCRSLKLHEDLEKHAKAALTNLGYEVIDSIDWRQYINEIAYA